MGSAPCRSCGQPLRAGVRVCTNCGVPVWSSDPPPAAQQPVSAGGVQTAPSPVITPLPTQPTEPMPAQGKVIRLKGRHVAILSAITALFLIGAVAAGALTAPEPKSAGELVGSLPFDADGGTKSFDDGAGKIKVPKGALDGPETIHVYRTVVRKRVTAASPTGTQLNFPPGALIAYTFGPVTLVFNRPVTITLPLPVAGQSGLIFVTANGEIRFFAGNVGGQTITIRLNSFDLTQPGAIVSQT